MNYRIKPVEELTMKDDYLFNALMKDEEICKGVVERLLGIPVREEKLLEVQKELSSFYDNKGIRMDVYLRDTDKVVNVEMQNTKRDNLEKRARYYQAILDMDSLAKGEDYSSIKDSYVLFLCNFDPFGKNMAVYHVTNCVNGNPEAKYDDGSHKIFYNINRFEQDENKSRSALLRFISQDNATDEFTNHLDKTVRCLKERETFRSGYSMIGLTIRDAKWEGKAEGRLEAKRDTALKMLEKGLEDSLICECTGLSQEELDDIRQSVQTVQN